MKWIKDWFKGVGRNATTLESLKSIRISLTVMIVCVVIQILCGISLIIRELLK